MNPPPPQRAYAARPPAEPKSAGKGPKGKGHGARKQPKATRTRLEPKTTGGRHGRADKRSRQPQDDLLDDFKRPKRVRRVTRIVLLVFASLLVLAGAAGAVVWYSAGIPLPKPPTQAQTSFVYDAQGTLLAELYDDENRVDLPFEAPEGRDSYRTLPRHLVDAVIAREDRRFFTHPGVDVRGIARAAWVDIVEGGNQGGSTIPQQYVKNVFLGRERSLTRKLNEAVIAVKLSRRYSKDEIMSMYLNTVYFGRGAYGIEAASNRYFSKPARDLTLGESAFLAGALSNPSRADPVKFPEEAQRRRDVVLDAMLATGSVTPEQVANEKYAIDPETAAVSVRPLEFRFTERKSIASAGSMAYFAEEVRQLLIERFGKERVLGGGLKVFTTIDPRVQQSAVDSVAFLDGEDDPLASVVTLDEQGRVVALVGGRDFGTSQVNLALGGKRIKGGGRGPGSTFKPIVLAAALRRDVPMSRSFPSPSSRTFDTRCGEWKVRGGSGRSQNLWSATASSSNTAFAALSVEIGADPTIVMARELGITSDLANCPSIALGGQPVSVLEMATAYDVFRNRGVRAQSDPLAQFVTKITDAAGNPVWESTVASPPVTVLPPEQADQVTQALVGVVDGGTGTRARLDDAPAAGKTGTTQENVDAWFVGFSPRYTTAVWVGYGTSKRTLAEAKKLRGTYGGEVAAPIFRAHMQRVVEGTDVGSFPGVEESGAGDDGAGDGRRRSTSDQGRRRSRSSSAASSGGGSDAEDASGSDGDESGGSGSDSSGDGSSGGGSSDGSSGGGSSGGGSSGGSSGGGSSGGSSGGGSSGGGSSGGSSGGDPSGGSSGGGSSGGGETSG